MQKTMEEKFKEFKNLVNSTDLGIDLIDSLAGNKAAGKRFRVKMKVLTTLGKELIQESLEVKRGQEYKKSNTESKK